jgi:hypothetical protein
VNTLESPVWCLSLAQKFLDGTVIPASDVQEEGEQSRALRSLPLLKCSLLWLSGTSLGFQVGGQSLAPAELLVFAFTSPLVRSFVTLREQVSEWSSTASMVYVFFELSKDKDMEELKEVLPDKIRGGLNLLGQILQFSKDASHVLDNLTTDAEAREEP